MAINYFHSPEVSEIVIALVGGIGVDHTKIGEMITDRLSKFNYLTHSIRISHVVLPKLVDATSLPLDKYKRATLMMDIGNEARAKHADEGIAALGAIAEIHNSRKSEDGLFAINRTAYIISSLKRPEEVAYLRQVYQGGFYLLGVYSSEKHRQNLLENTGKGMLAEQAKLLIKRDQAEQGAFGQETRKTFALSDFFIEENGDDTRLRSQIHRIVDLLFGHPYTTPTFDEYAMFLAVASSLHSADLSRQVGAVIARNDEVLSTGANDCPRAGGGLYWPEYCNETKAYHDREGGRDHTLKYDTNFRMRETIFASIANSFGDKKSRNAVLKALSSSQLNSLTEFGRMVHAEMEALLNCARNAISSRDASMYTTTFPCHNCAKHIVAAGLKEVIYVEPYPKSKALEFYTDSITEENDSKKVRFRPFIGVGARQFLNLFSMELGNGRAIKRKNNKDGNILEFDHATAETRVPLRYFSYLETEDSISKEINKLTAPPPCPPTPAPRLNKQATKRANPKRSLSQSGRNKRTQHP